MATTNLLQDIYDLAEEVKLPTKKMGAPKGEPKAKPRIFDRYKTLSLWKLEQSIEQAKGYFIEKERASESNPLKIQVEPDTKDENGKVIKAGRVVTKKQYFAAPNWTIKNRKQYEQWEAANDAEKAAMKKKNRGKDIYADIHVSIKVGGSASLKCFKRKNKKSGAEEDVGFFTCKELMLIPTLEKLHATLSQMESGDGNLGTDFHEYAKLIAKQNLDEELYEYNEELDVYVKLEEEGEAAA